MNHIRIACVTGDKGHMKFDLDYARKVIKAEADAIDSLTPIVDESFAEAVEMIYNCSGSCILSGIGKAGIIGRKISATLASTGTPSHFLHPAEAVHVGGTSGLLRFTNTAGGTTITITYSIPALGANNTIIFTPSDVGGSRVDWSCKDGTVINKFRPPACKI